jgi:hypothetical protein
MVCRVFRRQPKHQGATFRTYFQNIELVLLQQIFAGSYVAPEPEPVSKVDGAEYGGRDSSLT